MSLDLREFAELFFLPPFSLAAILTIGWLLRKRAVRAGNFLLVIGCAISAVVFFPFTGKIAIQPLFHAVEPWVSESLPRPEVIVVPTGGVIQDQSGRWWPNVYTITRLSSGLRLQEEISIPLIISGGPMADGKDSEAAIAARLFGLKETAKTLLEQRSNNTHETARHVAEILRDAKVETVLLVTTKWHMARIAATFRREGFRVVGHPTRQRIFTAIQWRDFVPSNRGIFLWGIVLREYLAIIWYLVAGRISIADLTP